MRRLRIVHSPKPFSRGSVSRFDGAPLQLWPCDYYETAQQFRFFDAPW